MDIDNIGKREILEPMKLESFGDYLFILYKEKSFFDIFKKDGHLQERIEMKNK